MVERQSHGFRFEKKVIEKYGYVKSDGYGEKYDATTKCGTPVQIKSHQVGNALDLGSAMRMKDNNKDILLHRGVLNGRRTVEEIRLKVDSTRLSDLLPSKKELESIKQRMDKYDSPDEPGFQRLLRDVQTRNRDSIVQVRLKKDHHGQSRIQAEVANRDIPEFERQIKKRGLFSFLK